MVEETRIIAHIVRLFSVTGMNSEKVIILKASAKSSMGSYRR